MKSASRLWRWLGLIFVLSFGALGYLGWQIYLSAPPIPKRVVTTEGEVLFTGDQVQLGQQAWMAAIAIRTSSPPSQSSTREHS